MTFLLAAASGTSNALEAEFWAREHEGGNLGQKKEEVGFLGA